MNHRGEGGFVVDALEAFHIRVGYDDVCVGAALGAAVVVAAARVGHVAGVAIDVDERADDVALAVGRDEGEQRAGAAVGVPDAVVVVVVGLGGLPVRVLAGAVGGHQHDVIHRGVELAALRVAFAGEIELGQLGVPECGRGGVDGGEVPGGDFLLHVLFCLLGADEGDADFGLDDLIGVGGEVEGGSDGGAGARRWRLWRRSGCFRSRFASSSAGVSSTM